MSKECSQELRYRVEILCGTEVSSSQVSRLAKELDEEITSWKAQPVGYLHFGTFDKWTLWNRSCAGSRRWARRGSSAIMLITAGIGIFLTPKSRTVRQR
ncbi:hypothetical protein F6P94_23765 (plasmid) [Escherichia coli]|nr:hypothetical protein F6P94_23765 [Escherichia coli]